MSERAKDDRERGGTTVSPAGDDAGASATASVAGTRSAEAEIRIDAPPDRVWRAVTEAAELVRWFPLDAELEPGEGGSLTLSWRNEFQATSEILDWEPNRCLRTGWGDGHGEAMGQVTEVVRALGADLPGGRDALTPAGGGRAASPGGRGTAGRPVAETERRHPA